MGDAERPILCGVKAIADLLGVHVDTVRVLQSRGAPIRSVGEGSSRRYFASRAALVAWAAGVEMPTGAEPRRA